MSGWDDRDFVLGRPQLDGESDISHPTASSGGSRRALHPSHLGLLTGQRGPHTFPWELAPDGGGCCDLAHPLLHLEQLFCLQSCCFPDMLSGCLSHTGLCWEPGWPGEVREAEGKGGRWSDAGAEASLTLFPAAASAISIYSPAASPPGHSAAAAAAGFQGCSVIKHPCLLQLPHFTSPGGDWCWGGHGGGARDQHQTEWTLQGAAPQQCWVLGTGPSP